MLNLHLLECTLKGYDHISDLLLVKYWVITGCKYAYCSSLTSVYCKAITPPVAVLYGGWEAFDNNASGRTIYVPMESVEAYKSASGWSDYADAIIGYNFE